MMGGCADTVAIPDAIAGQRAQIEQYVSRHPSASVPQVLGRFVLAPNDEAVVRAVEAIIEAEDANGTDNDERDETPTQSGDDGHAIDEEAQAAFTAAIEYFHDKIDAEIAAHTERGAHPDRPTTAREYYHDGRGWTDETIRRSRLGWAPSDRKLLSHLRSEGFSRDAILGTGLFTKFDDGQISQLWAGRYVLPYFDTDGNPAYAISRCTGKVGGGNAGYDGHSEDFISGKYGKLAHSKEYVHVDEPIFGLGTVEAGEPLLVAGGIADAISLHQAGYPCISPVTTVRFKGKHEQRVIDLVEEHDIPAVYIVNDAERPSIDRREQNDEVERITDVLTIEQHGEGLRGAFGDAQFLAEAGIETQLVTLPRANRSLRKVDPDDYLHDNWGALETLLAAAKPAEEHRGYQEWEENHQPRTPAVDRQVANREGDVSKKDAHDGTPESGDSELYDLDIRDVTGLSWDYRGVNPLGHHGHSENYFVLLEQYNTAYDYKYTVGYTPLTYLLCEAGRRSDSNPVGRLTDREILEAWLFAKRRGHIPDDDPIPRRALVALALQNDLCTSGEIEDGWKLPRGAYNEALECCPVETGREPLSGTTIPENPDGSRFIEQCAPPLVTASPVDVGYERERIQNTLYGEIQDAHALCIDVHPAGTGKTTTYTRAAAGNGDEHTIMLPTHENCREFQLDESKPDGYCHLKGAGQPRDDTCMDAKVAKETCSLHEHEDCPTMCPAYTHLDGDEYELFTALVEAAGVFPAHQILNLDEYDWHGDNCPWEEQFDALETEERVVTVHDYAVLKTVQKPTVFIDDLQGHFENERHLSAAELGTLELVFEGFAETARLWQDTYEKIAAFCRELSEHTCGGDAADITLDELGAPEFELPGGVTRSYALGKPMGIAECLSRVVRNYYERIRERVRTGQINGEPFSLNPLLAALAAAGGDSLGHACRIAMRQPFVLRRCPWNHDHGQLQRIEGRKVCVADGCGWTEGEDPMAGAEFHESPLRAVAAVADKHGGAANGDDKADGVVCTEIPPAAALPPAENTVLLDATPRVSVAKHLFGASNIQILGEREYELPNTQVAQIVDGAYHRSTLTSDEANASNRIQAALDEIVTVHENVLVVAMNPVLDKLDIPTNCETRHYGALRGLNHTECDAVVCIGAMHPPEHETLTTAQILTQGTETRPGGREFSTRRNSPNPPVYTKYRYEDDDGTGRAVATKAYSGLTGELFEAARTDEIEQAAHRIRPVLVEDDEPDKHVYLLTNVPTSMPVDTLTTLNAIDEPLRAALGVSEPPAEFIEGIAENVDSLADFEGTRREFEEVAEMDVPERTVREWMKQLRDAGHVEKAGYDSNGSMMYRLTETVATLFEGYGE